MKYRLPSLVLSLALVSCAQPERLDHRGEPFKIDPTSPPNGIQMVQILLENQSLPVKGTQCENGKDDERLLQHHLAMFLGEGFDSPLARSGLLASCQPNQYDLPSGGVIDAWQCRLGVIQKADKDEFGVGGSIYFGVTKDTWRLIPGPEALRCH